VQYRRKRPVESMTRGTKGLISYFVMFFAIGFLLLQLFSRIVWTFGDSPEAGFRSIAAAVLPLMISAYFGFIARPRMPVRDSRAPIINNFVIFLLWTVVIIGIDRSTGVAVFPLAELLYSVTLAAMLWRYRYLDSLKSLIAACYGILAGALAAIIIFGGLVL
jgi:hypothetical protein